jgi:hypothetical protein
MIPSPVLEAKDLADKVMKLEIDMNKHYRRTKRILPTTNLQDTFEAFKVHYSKVADLYPEWLHLIPNVSKPIFRR